MQCILVGNFGVGNLGDEALKQFFHTEFADVDWYTVSARPIGERELPRLPGGIRSLLTLRWLKTLKVYAECDAVVYGGGSLFTDTESVSACLLWWVHSLPARLFRKPIHLAFQGVGPFKSGVGKWFARSVLRSAATVSVRDSASANRVNNMCKSIKVVQSCDPVILAIEKEKSNLRTENVLTLIPRKNSSEKFMNVAQKFFESRSWDEVRVISMEPDNASEMSFVKSLVSRLGPPAALHTVRTLPELLSHISPAAQVISERYHGALPAVVFGKPVEIISQKSGDKLDELKHSVPSASQCDSGMQLLREALAKA